MPQILMSLAPHAQKEVLPDLPKVSQKMLETVQRVFPETRGGDVAFSAVPVLYIKYDCAVNVEVRYTAGKDEYHTGKIFDPNQKRRQELCDALMQDLRAENWGLTCSVWVIPIYHSEFAEE